MICKQTLAEMLTNRLAKPGDALTSARQAAC
jgi:hypothetical protein